MTFNAIVKNNSEYVRVIFKGLLNENAVLPVLRITPHSKLVFDWSDVSYINSVGIGKWVEYLSLLTKVVEPKNIAFQDCPFIIVEQMNKVTGFVLGEMKVNSFVVPYVCEACSTSKSILYEDKSNYDQQDEKAPTVHPQVQCTKCKKTMEMDVLPQRYFTFFDIIWERI